jgi:AbrB family looped-hinge helix DNA binding protein
MSEYLQIQINGKIILPASICGAANLQEGDLLEVVVEEDRSIRLIPQNTENRKMVEQAQLEDINWVLKHKQRS